MSTLHKFALIMAGGSGTRLWPMSRESYPKQFQPLLGSQTPFQHMLELTKTVVPIEQICVMCMPEFTKYVTEQAPDLPLENILFEPARRDNGPAITLALLQIEKIDTEAQVCIVWSDHRIQEPEAFTSALQASFSANEQYPEHMVIVGSNPTRPDTGLGYIEMSDELETFNGVKVFTAKRFIEKPDLAMAKHFVARWEYLWNVGYSTLRVSTFFNNFAVVQPDLQQLVEDLRNNLGNSVKISELYENFPKISIDYLYTQKQDKLIAVPADMGWSDIGSWQILHDVLAEGAENSLVTRGDTVTLDTTDSLIYSKDRPIAVVGVKDLIVVDTGDAILIMDKNAPSSRIKDLVTELKERNPKLL